MSTKIHPKRGLLVNKSVHEKLEVIKSVDEIHPFCPQKFALYVHEKSATLIQQPDDYSKCFMYVTKTCANLTTYSRKPENYNGTITFEIDIMKTCPQSI